MPRSSPVVGAKKNPLAFASGFFIISLTGTGVISFITSISKLRSGHFDGSVSVDMLWQANSE